MMSKIYDAWVRMLLVLSAVGLAVCIAWLWYCFYFHMTADVTTAEVVSIRQSHASYSPVIKYIDSQGLQQERVSFFSVNDENFYEVGDEVELLVKDGGRNADANHLITLYIEPLIVFITSISIGLLSFFVSFLLRFAKF